MASMRKPARIIFWAAFALALIIAAVTAVTALRETQVITAQAQRLRELETRNRELREQSERLARENNSLRERLGIPQVPAVRSAPRQSDASPSELEKTRALLKLQESLTAANATMGELQARIQEMETSMAAVREENQRLSASERELREKFESGQRVLEAVQGELKLRNNRLVQLETTNNLLHRDNRATAEKLGVLTQCLRDLEEINRRRELYLNNLLRRYRDLTERYRGVSQRLESPIEGRTADSAELSQIQNAISLAEEDLRQIVSLNAQANRVQQKLARK